jgi:Malectin domain
MSSRLGVRAPSVAECQDELHAVLASRVFRHAEQLSRLLQYVSEKALLGQAGSVTEYTIAVDVFGKPEGFRESRDSSVRVDVHRLRKRLAAFYDQEGVGHRLRIVIPPGSYVPEFHVFGAPPNHATGESIAPPAETEGPIGLPANPAAKPAVALLALVSLALIAIAGAVWLVWNYRRSAHDTRPASASILPAPVVNTEVHILAGFSGSAWTDSAGRLWQPDQYYGGGVSRPGPRELRASLPDHRLFRTMREAVADDLPIDRQAFTYDIPLRPATYELRLYFADPLKEGPLQQDGEDNENERRFTIHANGRALVEEFDVVADAGSADLDVRAFKDIAPASDGKVHLEFIPGPRRPFVNAIELVPSQPGHANPIRIAARHSSFTDSDGKVWGADNYSMGGRWVQHAMPAAARDVPELLREERYGNFSYVIPVPSGSYTLTLYFAETIFSPLAPPGMCRGPGCRVFDVTCNGVDLLHDFDVFQAGGGAFRVVTRSFHGLHPNGQGKLLVSFSPSVNYAEVQALEVTDESP